jgi:hypothetical protein
MTNTETNVYIPTEAAKRVRRFINTHRNWHRKCVALRNAEKNLSPDSIEYREAVRAWEKGRMPSKASKHHAYDYCRQLGNYIELTTDLEVKRAETVDDMAATLAQFTALVGS